MSNSGNERAKTMKDIAKLAGVSVSTASRALSDSPMHNEATKERVRAIAREHGYRPHLGARNFRLKKTNTIVIILPYQLDTSSVLTNPYAFKMLSTVGTALREQGYDLLLSRLDDITPEIDDYYIHSGLASGAIFLGRAGAGPEKLSSLVATGIPFVVLGPAFEGQGYCSVGIDNIDATYKAISHLIDLGRRRIAIISDNFDLPHTEAYLRYQGYLKALNDAEITVDDDLLIRCTTTVQSGYTAVEELLEKAPDVDAIFVVSDVQAIAAIQALGEAQRRVPEDVAVVGFDNIDLCDFIVPPLTSVSQRLNDGVASVLVDKLLKIIDGQSVESVMLEGKLIVRYSCGAKLGD